MLKIDRSAVDEAIKNMNMFTATLEVLASYEAEKKVLKERGEHLTQKLAQLQEQHATTLIDREVAKDSPSEYVYLSKQLKEIDEETKVLNSLQEQLKDEFTELKLKYAPTIAENYRKDKVAKAEFDVNATVEYVRYELIKAIADYANEVKKQDAPLMPLIYEFLDDKEVMEAYRGFRRTFDFDRTDLYYSEANNAVIHRQNIFLACSGGMPSEIRKPKEKK